MDLQLTPAGSDTSTSDVKPRQSYFLPGREDYAYYEGSSVSNTCTRDDNCMVTGCTHTTCAAEVMEIVDQGFCSGRLFAQWPEPQLARCGCLSGECRWYIETDYDRSCDEDADCLGLGRPPAGGIGKSGKGIWECVEGKCKFQ